VVSADVVFDLKQAAASYGGRRVLDGLDLTIRRGERVAIMGRSGAGKSTLLSLLYDASPEAVALIPQSAALVKPLSVFHNVYMGRLDRHKTLYNLRNLVWPHAVEVAAVKAALDEVELADKLFEPAGALSGGQQQRASIARALFNGRRYRRSIACRAAACSAGWRRMPRRWCSCCTTSTSPWSMPGGLYFSTTGARCWTRRRAA
jgi:phosphonate transport system ATP-binding protein